jgi:hypothetical protein
MTHTVEQHFEGRSPLVREIYEALLRSARRFGPVEEDPKKTSIHLNRKSALAGVQTRKNHLILTLKLDKDISSDRVLRSQHASANRWYAEIRLQSPDEVDVEMHGWIERAYAISA